MPIAAPERHKIKSFSLTLPKENFLPVRRQKITRKAVPTAPLIKAIMLDGIAIFLTKSPMVPKTTIAPARLIFEVKFSLFILLPIHKGTANESPFFLYFLNLITLKERALRLISVFLPSVAGTGFACIFTTSLSKVFSSSTS